MPDVRRRRQARSSSRSQLCCRSVHAENTRLYAVSRLKDPQLQQWAKLALIVVAGLALCYFLLSFVGHGGPFLGGPYRR
jgi:hypothetical protein